MESAVSNFKKINLENIVHICILLISFLLGIYMVAKGDYNNSYYAAGVKSMLVNFHNFFFNSYDPAGFISIDKPPLAFWIQTMSAKLFGYHLWALALPSLFAQIFSVELLYRMVKKVSGEWAGLLAAGLLVLTPINFLLSTTNEIDSILILLLLLSGWALFKSIEENKFKYMLLSVIFLGLAFNTKMLEAFIILPAFIFTYIYATKNSWNKKIKELSIALSLLLIISFSWILIVCIIPVHDRPYVGSTVDNSEMSLVMGYNGLQRFLGQEKTVYENNIIYTNVNFGGQPGAFRLWSHAMGSQIGWYLLFALFGLFAIFLKEKIILPFSKYQTAGIFWGLWLIMGAFIFSTASFMHPYYNASIAPAICALFAIGITVMIQFYKEAGWKKRILPIAILSTAISQWIILHRYTSYTLLGIIEMSILSIIAIIFIVEITRKSSYISECVRKNMYLLLIIVLGAILLAPVSFIYYNLSHSVNNIYPWAGPYLGPKIETVRKDNNLLNFLIANQGTTKFILATENSHSADNLIIESGQAVLPIGGFSGLDPAITLDTFKQYISDGLLRYVYLGQPGRKGESTVVIPKWVISSCSRVNICAYLYDCQNFKK